MSTMRTVFLRPRSPYADAYYPLGLMHIAAAVRAARPDDVLSIVHAQFERLNDVELAGRLRQLAPDVVALTGLTDEAAEIHAAAAVARAIGARVVVGGPHASSMPESLLADAAIDAVCLGEGEATMVDYLSAIERGEDLAGIPGLWTRNAQGTVIRNPDRPAIEDLDALPLPAWDLLDVERMMRAGVSVSWAARRDRTVSMMTSRGCPYRCTYCHEFMGKRFRVRSLDHVFAELELLKRRYGANEIEIVDDIFNFDKERTKAFCRRLIASGLDYELQFPNGTRVDMFDEETIDLLVQAGATRLVFAIETVTPAIQRQVKKNIRFKRAEQIISHAVRYRSRLNLGGFFMIGFPGETYEQARRTVDYAVRSPFHSAAVSIVDPRPDTVLYRETKASGIAAEPLPPDGERRLGDSPVNLSAMTDRELYGLRREAFRRLYLRPRRVYWLLRHTRFRRLWSTGWRTLILILTGRGTHHGEIPAHAQA